MLRKSVVAFVCLLAANAACAEPFMLRGYVAAEDSTPLAYTVYRPAESGKYPTVVWFDVYGAGSMPAGGMVQAWVKRGYAFAAVSARGTACSGGEYIPFSEQDAKDGARFVDWAGDQAWSTGKVGLIGSSQPGIVQFGVAAQKPKHLAAIAPGGTVGRLYSDGWYFGGIYNVTFAAHWSRVDQPGASRALANLRIQQGDEACKAVAAKIGPNPLLSIIEGKLFDDPYYRQASPFELAPTIDVPTLMVQSWTDPAVGSGALNVYERVKARHKRLFVLSGDHSAYLYSTAQDEVMRWMDRWLKGERNGAEKAPHARIDFGTKWTPTPLTEIEPATAVATTLLKDWPSPDTTWRTFNLGADGKLSETAPEGAAAGTRQYFYPSGTELPGDQGQFALAAWDWGSLAYRSAPMAQDLAIVGAPQLTFHASAERTDTDFMVTLHDVAPNGDVTFIQRGYLRASHRAVDAARSTAQYAYHPHLAEEPLEPGKVYEFRLSIWPTVHVLRAGHALEVLIAAPSTTPSNWGLAPKMLPGANTVYHDAARASTLSVPVVPGIKAAGPEPECGSLPFQPCRAAKK